MKQVCLSSVLLVEFIRNICSLLVTRESRILPECIDQFSKRMIVYVRIYFVGRVEFLENLSINNNKR